MIERSKGRELTGPFPAGWRWLDPRSQLSYLVKEWRLMFRPATMPADSLAAIAVALVALPLSLAIATASGVPPVLGLVTAILGGIVVPLAGGSRLQVSGPAAAMTFLVFEIVSRFGMGGLATVTMIAAALQILAGAMRLGRFIQLIPRPVVAGFLSGIGLTILCTQLPVVLGYEIQHTDEGGALGLLWMTLKDLPRTQVTSLVVGGIAIACTLGLPRLAPSFPRP